MVRGKVVTESAHCSLDFRPGHFAVSTTLHLVCFHIYHNNTRSSAEIPGQSNAAQKTTTLDILMNRYAALRDSLTR